ncbi:MAG: response regulator [Deltaproteobacteria bacterium]|nr:response regulator [Deltaproteobacteria bacterium]
MKKILIIDDDRDIVDSLSIILESQGYQIEVQYNDRLALETALKTKPDAIILDVMFPENDGAGFEIARELKEHNDTKDIPILMLSAVNAKGEYAGTFSNRDRDDTWLPVDEFVEKPIAPKKLLETFKKLFAVTK